MRFASPLKRLLAGAAAALLLLSLAACARQEGINVTSDGIYYLDEKGAKVTGFQQTEGALYYFGEDGKLVRDPSLWPPAPSGAQIAEPAEPSDDLSACSEDLLGELDRVIASVNPGEDASVEDRLWSVFEWMSKNLSYQFDTVVDLSEGYTEPLIASLAEHTIFELKGACEHQAALYYLFARRLGCKAMVVEGEFIDRRAKQPEWTEHGWVIVELDGSYRHCDVLYGRNHTRGKPRTMFLITDEKMAENHRWNLLRYPACR